MKNLRNFRHKYIFFAENPRFSIICPKLAVFFQFLYKLSKYWASSHYYLNNRHIHTNFSHETVKIISSSRCEDIHPPD